MGSPQYTHERRSPSHMRKETPEVNSTELKRDRKDQINAVNSLPPQQLASSYWPYDSDAFTPSFEVPLSRAEQSLIPSREDNRSENEEPKHRKHEGSIVSTTTASSPISLLPIPKTEHKPTVIRALPTVRDHTTDELAPSGDEYLPREIDQAGEVKVTSNGYLLDGREYRCRTFFVPERGDKLFMLATECARVLGYRDSYLLFNKNRSLYKIIANRAEKDDLIHQEILPYSYRSRQIAIVTARSMFRQFGSRLIVNGRRVRDDYWEVKARKQGFTEEDAAGEKRPGAAKAREAAAEEANHAATLGAAYPGAFASPNTSPIHVRPFGPPHFYFFPENYGSFPRPMQPSNTPIDHLGSDDITPKPRPERIPALYPHIPRPMISQETLTQAAQTVEINKQFEAQRKLRQQYLDDLWNRSQSQIEQIGPPVDGSRPFGPSSGPVDRHPGKGSQQRTEHLQYAGSSGNSRRDASELFQESNSIGSDRQSSSSIFQPTVQKQTLIPGNVSNPHGGASIKDQFQSKGSPLANAVESPWFIYASCTSLLANVSLVNAYHIRDTYGVLFYAVKDELMRLRLWGAGLSEGNLLKLSYVSAEMYESTTLLLVETAAILLERLGLCPLLSSPHARNSMVEVLSDAICSSAVQHGQYLNARLPNYTSPHITTEKVAPSAEDTSTEQLVTALDDLKSYTTSLLDLLPEIDSLLQMYPGGSMG